MIVVIVGAGVLASCFNPHVVNGGFLCDPTQNPSCPAGFFCVDGRCVDQSSGAGGSGGNGGGGGSTPADLGSPSLDMSMSVDLAHGSTHDFSMGGTCAHSLCVTGSTLTSGCDPCVTQICAQDSYCCMTKWSSQCVTEVTSICGRSCP